MLNVKPVADAWKAYQAALGQWRKAEDACVALHRESRASDLSDAQEAVDAVRAGKPIPKGKAAGISASVQAAERAVDAHLTVAKEAEQRLLQTLDDHYSEVEAAAELHAHTVTQRLLNSIGDALTADWHNYVEAQDVLARVETGRWGAQYSQAGVRMRYNGQDRDLADLLGDVLRLIDRTDPNSARTRAEIQRLTTGGGPAGYEEAIRLTQGLGTPPWAEVLAVPA